MGYFIQIDDPIRSDKNISVPARFLYGEVAALAKREGYCWAPNSHFSELMSCTDRSVRNYIAELAKKGYLDVQTDGHHRKIFVVQPGNQFPGTVGNPEKNDTNPETGFRVQGGNPEKIDGVAEIHFRVDNENPEKNDLEPGNQFPHKNNSNTTEYNYDVDQKAGVVKKLQPVKPDPEFSLFPTNQPAASPNNEPHPPGGAAPPAPEDPADENSPYWHEQLTAFESNEFIVDEVGMSRHLPKEAVMVLRRRFIADKRIEGIVKPSSELRRNFLRWVDKGLRDGYIERRTGTLKIESQQDEQTTAFTRGKSAIEQQNDAFLKQFNQHGLHPSSAKGA